MPRAIGDPIDVHEIDHAVMRTAIERLQEIHHELASTNKVGLRARVDLKTGSKMPDEA